jgi:hypothetical protein
MHHPEGAALSCAGLKVMVQTAAGFGSPRGGWCEHKKPVGATGVTPTGLIDLQNRGDQRMPALRKAPGVKSFMVLF